MQKVAWPTMIVHRDRLIPLNRKNDCRAIPVTMPGRAMGSTRRKETVSRPKNRNRCTAKAAADPSRRAIIVERRPAFTDNSRASLTSESCQAIENHFSE